MNTKLEQILPKMRCPLCGGKLQLQIMKMLIINWIYYHTLGNGTHIVYMQGRKQKLITNLFNVFESCYPFYALRGNIGSCLTV